MLPPCVCRRERDLPLSATGAWCVTYPVINQRALKMTLARQFVRFRTLFGNAQNTINCSKAVR
jgi:hypothetical protein